MASVVLEEVLQLEPLGSLPPDSAIETKMGACTWLQSA